MNFILFFLDMCDEDEERLITKLKLDKFPLALESPKTCYIPRRTQKMWERKSSFEDRDKIKSGKKNLISKKILFLHWIRNGGSRILAE